MSTAGPSTVATQSVGQAPEIDNSASYLYASGQELVNLFDSTAGALEALVPDFDALSTSLNAAPFDSSIPYRSHLAIFDARLALIALCYTLYDLAEKSRAVALSIFRLQSTIETEAHFLIRVHKGIERIVSKLAEEGEMIREWRMAWNSFRGDVRRLRHWSLVSLVRRLKGSRQRRNGSVMKTKTARLLYRTSASVGECISLVEVRFGELKGFLDSWLENILLGQGSPEGVLNRSVLAEHWDIYKPITSSAERYLRVVTLLEHQEPHLRFDVV